MSERPEIPDLDVDFKMGSRIDDQPTAGASGRPASSGLKVTTAMPYRILWIADLAGPSGAISGPPAEGPVDVNAESFDALMAAAAPTVTWKATNPLVAGNVMVEETLRFDSLKAFEPANLARQIPATDTLMNIREQLVARMRGKLSAQQLSQAVSKAIGADAGLAWLTDSLAWTPAKAASPDVVDSLLGQLDLGDGQDAAVSPPPKSPIGAIVSAAAAGASIPAEEASAIRRTLGEIDRRVGAWLTAVLHAPAIQAVESAWRSLAFMVSHIEFRKGLKLSVLHAKRDELIVRFTSGVIDPVFDEGMDAPDLIAVDHPFGNTAPDMEVLDELAQHGASLPAVVLAGVSASFFGVKQAWQVPTLPAFISMFDQYQFAKFKTLRGQPYARSLGLIFGRCLLRPPHRRDDAPDLEFAFREEVIADADLIWASGPVAAAVSVARSVADTGWPTAMAGHLHGRVDGFVTAMGGKKGDKKFGPTDNQLPQPKLDELAVVGLNAAGGLRDIDDAVLWNGLTAARPMKADHIGLLEISLPYQLFAARISALLFALKPHLAGLSPEQIVPFVTAHVCDWVGITGQPAPEQVLAQVRPAEDDPSAMQLAVTVAAPDKVLPGGIPVVLGYRLS